VADVPETTTSTLCIAKTDVAVDLDANVGSSPETASILFFEVGQERTSGQRVVQLGTSAASGWTAANDLRAQGKELLEVDQSCPMSRREQS
jgi:hypothetical protein